MSSRQMTPGQSAEQLNADAVCAQCGTVYPEETLICKVCGNNLRDQRSVRMAADQAMVGDAPRVRPGRWLLQGLAFFGTIVILLTAFNIDAITRWMIDPAASDEDFVRVMFTEGESAIYEDLLAELRADMPTQEALAAASTTPSVVVDLEGIYGASMGPGGGYAVAIVRKAEEQPAPEEGAAEGLAPREQFHFVALLQPEGEVRGKLESRGGNIIARERSAGAQYGDSFLSVWGAGLIGTEGGIRCFGTVAGVEEGIAFNAFQLKSFAQQ